MNWILVSALLLFATALMWAALRRLKQFRLKERYALIFLLSSVPFLALAVNPDLIRLAAVQLGIDYRTLQLMAVTAFLVFVVIELLTIVSVQERRITRLAQQVAMLDQWQHQREGEATGGEPSATHGQPQANGNATSRGGRLPHDPELPVEASANDERYDTETAISGTQPGSRSPIHSDTA